MALLKGGGFNEGSLLRRTLLHVGTFAVGTAAFVAIVSFVLVTAAKSLLPSHGAKADSATKKDDTAATAEGEAPAKPVGPKAARSKRSAGVIVQEETPNDPSDKE